MRSQLVTLAVLLAAPELALHAAEKPVHLFILSGQSNMAGLKPETDFLPEAKLLLPSATVAHIKVAVGGQPIRYWVPEWDRIATDAGLNQKSEKGAVYYDQILAEFKKAKSQHGDFASITFCWMQGERDAKSGLAPAYETALTQLIANLRRDLKCPDLNIVIGRLSDHSTAEGWESVRAAQVKVAKADLHGAWVDTDDLNDKMVQGRPANDLHYTREGYTQFGQRLARQAVRLIERGRPDATGRPPAPAREPAKP